MRQAELEKGEAVERMQRNVETLKQVRRHCFFFALEFNPKTNIQGHEQEVELQKAAHCKELSKIQQQMVSTEYPSPVKTVFRREQSILIMCFRTPQKMR